MRACQSVTPGLNTKMAALGGYDYDFTDDIPAELQCSICLHALRDPNLTSCCGNRYCNRCIDRVQQNRMPCPLCQSRDFTLMLDKMYVRKVNSLRVKCPNTNLGCDWHGDLGNVKEHQESCKAVTVPCSFHSIGCDAMVPLTTTEDHLNATSGMHLTLLLQAVQKKDKQIASLELAVSSLQLAVSTLQLVVSTLQLKVKMLRHDVAQQESKQYPPVEFVMDNFYSFMDSDTIWYSDGFYTHPHGYKMCLKVYANGTGKGKDTHVSVFATLMKGEYDDFLEWLFNGHVTVELLDPDSEGIEEVEEVFTFNTRTPPRAKRRCICDEHNAHGHGDPEFILQSEIPDSVDALNFRVTSVSLK